MALIRLDHTPATSKVNSPLFVILPNPVDMKGVPVRERKILYLLHGLSDDGSAWQRYTAIETYANRYGLVVVMPSVGRSFYTDLPNDQQYFTYLIQELPRYLEDVFGITPRRENTLIAGNSMGGYGALKAALNYPQRFFAAASFSGLVSMAIGAHMPHDDPRRNEFTWIFGDPSTLPGGEHDPVFWLQRAVQVKQELPYLYISCGRQEDLFPLHLHFTAACSSLGVDVASYDYDGTHTWPYWDLQIQRFLANVLGSAE